MTGKIRIMMVAMATAATLVAAAPAVLADTPVTLTAYECADLGTETVRVDAEGVVHIRNLTFLGESESADPRFDGLFRRTTHATLYPDGSAHFWGVHTQRSSTYDGSWALRFNVTTPDGNTFSGHGQGVGSRAFAGLTTAGTINNATGGSSSPCHPVLGVSEYSGVVFD